MAREESGPGEWRGLAAARRLVLLGVFAIAAAGCRGESSETFRSGGGSGDDRLQVAATVGMVADLVRQVGGEHVQVDQIMGSGVDPHLYKPTRDDVQRLMQADIVFYCGLMLEGKMEDTLKTVGRQRPVYAVTDVIDPARLLEPEGAGGHADPHVWMDVATWSTCLPQIAEQLGTARPEHAAEFQANAERYAAELAQLHAYGKSAVATIPEDRRIVITSHDAFNYFGRAYDTEVRGVQGLSTESEAGLQQINALVDLIVERKIPAVFVESSVSQKSVAALIDGARSRGRDVRIGGELYSDAMGPAGTYEGTYVGMLDHNITTIVRALGGEAPAGGFQGKLSTP